LAGVDYSDKDSQLFSVGRLLPKIYPGLFQYSHTNDSVDKERSAIHLERSVPGGIRAVEKEVDYSASIGDSEQ
jgi:hypothetical protein